MNEKKIVLESMTYTFFIEENQWHLRLPKSQTNIRDLRQLALLEEASSDFVPVTASDEGEMFIFSFHVDPNALTWKTVLKRPRHDKLRLLRNVASLRKWLKTRKTFFLHPDNLVFDDNLMPALIYRGVRDAIPPYELRNDTLVTQFKCLAIALFSTKYTFDQLYSGSLMNAKETEFERQLVEANDWDTLLAIIDEYYGKAKQEAAKKLVTVPKKKFILFRRLTYALIGAAVLLIIPLVYLGFFVKPFDSKMIDAHSEFLKTSYGNVIDELHDVKPDQLSAAGQYILAYSYVKTARLSEEQKETVLKNVSQKSDTNYLLYWISTGRGEYDESIELAKSMENDSLLTYASIGKKEQLKNDRDLDASTRDSKIQELNGQINQFKKDHNLDEQGFPLPKKEESQPATTQPAPEKKAPAKSDQDKKKEKEKEKAKEKEKEKEKDKK
ncbi:hypothetical protein A374_18831 [Fictibacillus macauensis ZFHKF-1]|uniref:Type VII secretion protein EssB n=1 Tax=Fictibacillus macauensis ZFHKF-1 TaxID=1196324 RepID=I8AEL1_9BACL|nr:type VII secretion protein EssB [Fictibacillus macauensis]EIT83774.1 hypothetical protein A374_18831 [Fictibacillus macauensis ZFHKF-1]